MSCLLVTPLRDNDFITYKNIGQLALDKPGQLEVDTFIGKDFVLNSGNNITINAGNESITMQVGMNNMIVITKDRVDINTDNLFINGVKYNK